LNSVLTRSDKTFYSSVMTKAVIVLLAAALSASAHHSFGAEYDANKPITLTGVVTKVEWTNPHSFFYLDVKDASEARRLPSQRAVSNRMEERGHSQAR
jgi:hypothetical protein